jgi:hypothetical protein
MREAADARAARCKKHRDAQGGRGEAAARSRTEARRKTALPSWSPASSKWRSGELCEATVAEYLAGPSRKFKRYCPTPLRPLTHILLDHLNKHTRERIRVLLLTVVRLSPKIIDDRYMAGFLLLVDLPWIRPLDEWKPRGCSRDSIFKSLVAHLLVTYPVPDFLYSIFMGERHSIYSYHYAKKLFMAAARGESPYGHFLRTDFPVRMTRQMCHLLMHMPSGTGFTEGIRHAQILVNGGDIGIARAVCGTMLGRDFQGYREPFWDTVLCWLCRQSDIERRQIGPLVDYFAHMRETDPFYSIKGRTVKSTLRAMEEWHRELAIHRELGEFVFKASGFKGKKYVFKKKLNGGPVYHQEWTVKEILHSGDLMEEGKHMRHCVSCYATDIKEGRSSIWSLRCDGARALTVEVANGMRRVVQARGKCNRNPKPLELGLLHRWALANELELRSPNMQMG